MQGFEQTTEYWMHSISKEIWVVETAIGDYADATCMGRFCGPLMIILNA